MKKNILMRTNIMVCLVVLVGYLMTAVLSYQANYESAILNIEQITSLSSEGIYFQLTSTFAKPVNVSLTMANDSLLGELLEEEEQHAEEEVFIKKLKQYLNAYQIKYAYDSVFLVSAATNRYYNFNGLDRTLTPEDPENKWYYDFLESEPEHSLNIDNDEASNDEITVFVNCKIRDVQGKVLGIVGVGQRVGSLQALLEEYEDEFGVNAYLINKEGLIEISTQHTGYEQYDFFSTPEKESLRGKVLGWEKDTAQNFWAITNHSPDENDFIVTRYLPELSWYLLVERDTGKLIGDLRNQLAWTATIIIGIIGIILLVITYAIRGFNREILNLTSQQEESFRKATEQLYDDIYEINVTKNCAASISTQRLFESLGIPKNMPFDKAIRVLAEKQVKEEFREGYVSLFLPENVMKESEKGNTHLAYEYLLRKQEGEYCWTRIDAYIYRQEEDNTLHMFTYHKNIDDEVRQKQEMTERVRTDPMTQLYNKKWTHHAIENMLLENQEREYAFFIFDIDNFKQANDLHGHAFGDFAIMEFVSILQKHFRTKDILGRIGGDEFVAFIPIPDECWVLGKTKELAASLRHICVDQGHSWKMSSSIGVAIFPRHGRTFEELYQNADTALYCTKDHGKSGFTIYDNKDNMPDEPNG